MKKIPNFNIVTENGSVSLVFQTTSHKCVMKFVNETLIVEIDGTTVFEASKE